MGEVYTGLTNYCSWIIFSCALVGLYSAFECLFNWISRQCLKNGEILLNNLNFSFSLKIWRSGLCSHVASICWSWVLFNWHVCSIRYSCYHVVLLSNLAVWPLKSLKDDFIQLCMWHRYHRHTYQLYVIDTHLFITAHHNNLSF